MSNLGFLYYKKAKINSSEEYFHEAAHWFRFAAAEDDSIKDAHYYLGWMHLAGTGVDQSFSYAFKYFKRAAELGHDLAWLKIGDLCYGGFESLKADKTTAFNWYLKGAERGNPQCVNNIGLMLEFGFDQQPANQKEAFRKYEEASEMGNADATFNLGLAYQNGMYVEPDDVKAIDLMKMSANMGNVKAQEYLIYLGIVKDKSEFIISNELNVEYSDEDYEMRESEDENETDTIKNPIIIQSPPKSRSIFKSINSRWEIKSKQSWWWRN